MTDGLTALTTEIVSSYVGGNRIAANELPALIKSVYQSLCTVETAPADEPPAMEKATPAQIRKSIRPEGLISFEDGKPYKTLKRHLTARGLSLADYKAKWGLPTDYPTTSPDYSAARSQMAKSLGLGQVRKAVVEPKAQARKGKPKPPKA